MASSEQQSHTHHHHHHHSSSSSSSHHHRSSRSRRRRREARKQAWRIGTGFFFLCLLLLFLGAGLRNIDLWTWALVPVLFVLLVVSAMTGVGTYFMVRRKQKLSDA